MDKLTENLNLETLQLSYKIFSKQTGRFIQSKWNNVIDLTGEDPKTMWIYGILIYTMVYYWLFGTIFTFMDITGKPKFLRRLKVQPGTNEPVETKKTFTCSFGCTL